MIVVIDEVCWFLSVIEIGFYVGMLLNEMVL